MNAKLNTSKEVFDSIKNHLKGFQFFNGSWYLPSSIPSKKLANAHKTIIKNFDKDEFPILYCDTTLMGGGDDSVIITNKRIKCKPFIGDEFSIYFEDEYEVGYLAEIEVVEEHNWIDKVRNGTLEFVGAAGGTITSTTVQIITRNKLGKGADIAIQGGFKLFAEWLKVENHKTQKGKETKLVKKKIFATDFTEKDYDNSDVVINYQNNLYILDIMTNRLCIANFLRLVSTPIFTFELENIYSDLSDEYKIFLRDNFNPRIKI